MLIGKQQIVRQYKYVIRLFGLLLILNLISIASSAQETIPPTSTTDTKAKIKKKKERPKRERYMTIIKTNTKKTLYGNKCFEDFTKQLGFVYEIQVKGQSGSINGFTRFWHNAATKTALVFTAWPWWKLRVNKRYKECRKSSGDFVG
jgi:hypothetical protein